MAGHSKWANIKYRKATQDFKRGKIFTKIIRELVTAMRIGGNDLSSNPRLRTVINKALSNNMTYGTLNRVISHSINGNKIIKEKIIYECYGPGGIAIMLECLSNNRNRTVAKIRHILNKYDGHLSTDGSVTYLFEKKGVLSFEKGNEETILELALLAGAEDVVKKENGTVNVYTIWQKTTAVLCALERAGIKADKAEVIMIPSKIVTVNAEVASKFFLLIDMLKSYEDVQKIYHNGKNI